ncbi:hypothetical protein EV126DRAFT_427966 [Verticillium dahliae]|nr:hypothetical protein EV126DRAFT_427966 [Verticillium dahliae]
MGLPAQVRILLLSYNFWVCSLGIRYRMKCGSMEKASFCPSTSQGISSAESCLTQPYGPRGHNRPLTRTRWLTSLE